MRIASGDPHFCANALRPIDFAENLCYHYNKMILSRIEGERELDMKSGRRSILINALALLLSLLTAMPGGAAFADCEHANTRTEDYYDLCITEEPTEEYHVNIHWQEVYCADCGDYLYEAHWDYDWEDHSFGSDNICDICGYSGRDYCLHPERSTEKISEPYFDPNEGYNISASGHIIWQNLETYCDLCGELVDVYIENEWLEAHDYNDDGKCRVCGYSLPLEQCDHSTRRTLKSSRLTPKGRSEHILHETYRVFCLCGKVDKTEEEEATLSCSFTLNQVIMPTHEPDGHPYRGECACGNTSESGGYAFYYEGCPTCAEIYGPNPVRQSSVYSEEAKRMQLRLAELGYLTSSCDGIFGKMTLEALLAFQRDFNLPESGILSPDTEDILFDPSLMKPIVQSSAYSERAKELQIMLSELGYLTSTCDGIFGKKTLEAVKAFQRDHNLPETGVVNSATLQAIEAALNGEVPEDKATDLSYEEGRFVLTCTHEDYDPATDTLTLKTTKEATIFILDTKTGELLDVTDFTDYGMTISAPDTDIIELLSSEPGTGRRICGAWGGSEDVYLKYDEDGDGSAMTIDTLRVDVVWNDEKHVLITDHAGYDPKTDTLHLKVGEYADLSLMNVVTGEIYLWYEFPAGTGFSCSTDVCFEYGAENAEGDQGIVGLFVGSDVLSLDGICDVISFDDPMDTINIVVTEDGSEPPFEEGRYVLVSTHENFDDASNTLTLTIGETADLFILDTETGKYMKSSDFPDNMANYAWTHSSGVSTSFTPGVDGGVISAEEAGSDTLSLAWMEPHEHTFIPVASIEITVIDPASATARYILDCEHDYYRPLDRHLYLSRGEIAGLSVIDTVTGESIALTDLPGASILLEADSECARVEGLRVTGHRDGNGALVLDYYGLELDRIDISVMELQIREYSWGMFTQGEESTAYNSVVTQDMMMNLDWSEYGLSLTPYLKIFEYAEKKTDGGRTITFEAYNDIPMLVGFVSYDADGNIHDIQYANGCWEEVSLVGATVDFWEGLTSLRDGKDGNSGVGQEKTDISLDVPDGGWYSVVLPTDDDTIFASAIVDAFFQTASLYSTISKAVNVASASQIASGVVQNLDSVSKQGLTESVQRELTKTGTGAALKEMILGEEIVENGWEVAELLWSSDINLFELAFENMDEAVKQIILATGKEGVDIAEDLSLIGIGFTAYLTKVSGNILTETTQLYSWMTHMRNAYHDATPRSIQHVLMPR